MVDGGIWPGYVGYPPTVRGGGPTAPFAVLCGCIVGGGGAAGAGYPPSATAPGWAFIAGGGFIVGGPRPMAGGIGGPPGGGPGGGAVGPVGRGGPPGGTIWLKFDMATPVGPTTGAPGWGTSGVIPAAGVDAIGGGPPAPTRICDI